MIRGFFFVACLGLACAGALAACGQKSSLAPTDLNGSTATGGGGGGGGDDGGTGDGSVCGLAEATALALPAIAGVPPGSLVKSAGSVPCTTSGTFTYALRDFDGDVRPDLIVTSACGDVTVGASAWLVYAGTAGGFAASATRITLPVASPTPGCAKEVFADVNGDLKPDIVVTTLCSDATVGTTRWLYYASTGAGFATQLSVFQLPPGMTAGAFPEFSSDTPTCGSITNHPAYAAVDVDGDAVLDVLITSACDDSTVGTSKWRFHKGSATGVAQTAATFALPTTPAVTLGAYAKPYQGALACTSTQTAPSYVLGDMNGDSKPDLLVLQACDDTNVGASKWRLYANDGTKLAAAPVDFALPQFYGAPNGTFTSLGNPTAACNGGSGAPAFQLADVNGDRKYDLLVPHACSDVLSGVSHWLYFASTGTGFSAAPEQFAIPLAFGGTTTSDVPFGEATDCDGGAGSSFEMGYATGSHLGALVTRSCSDATLGSTRWLFYPDTCP